MAKGVINLQKESGGVTKVTSTDGIGITELVLPESGNVVSTDNSVTDNAVARYDGTTGKLQNSGVIVDDNNNVGIGVTPSAWRTEAKAVQLGASGSIESLTNNGSYVSLNANNYNNGLNDIYINTAAVTKYQQLLGTHSWYTAPAGTAGNPITWTNAMTLDASGVLTVQSTPTNGRINIGASNNYIYGNTVGTIIIGTAGSDKLTLNVNGNLLIGTSTDNGVDKLQVNGSIISRSAHWKYTDLNDANTVDEKIIVDNTCLNIPVNDYGYVTVQVSTPYTYCMQTFTPLNSPMLFIRIMSGGTWSAWVEK